jgi:hypothetical protein
MALLSGWRTGEDQVAAIRPSRYRGNLIMSTHVVTEFHAMPGRGGDVEKLLLEILGESLEHEGCKAIRILRDQNELAITS